MRGPVALESAVAALAFAASFLFGGRFHPLRPWLQDRRTMLSFGGGMAAAYMFVHVMPELHTSRTAFAEGLAPWLRYEGMSVYFVALLGFLVFYALDHMRRKKRGEHEKLAGWASAATTFGGFALYAWLVSYLLVNSLEVREHAASTLLYAVAMAMHFIALDHTLQLEHGDAYRMRGRFILAGACLAGWLCGGLFAVPREASAILLAFLCGAIIINSTLLELPTGRDGRPLPFVAGGLLYGLVLLPLG